MFADLFLSVGDAAFVDPICFSDLEDFPPNLFNARCYLPFVHRSSGCDLLRMHEMSLAAKAIFLQSLLYRAFLTTI